LYQLKMLVRPYMRRALEKHMLEEMRESGSAGLFIRRPYMIPEVDSHNWCGVILGQRYEQAVVEMESFYRNSHCRKLPAMQTHWNPLGNRT
jgi:hypothetical protein